MTWLAAIAVGLALLLYLRSPFDLLPDMLGPIGLLDDVLVVFGAAWWVRRRLARARAERARASAAGGEGAAGEGPWDPHAVLGVTRSASAEEITRAYREQMRRYHPDHVAHLGEELQQLAHRKAVDIQRAYAEIGKP